MSQSSGADEQACSFKELKNFWECKNRKIVSDPGKSEERQEMSQSSKKKVEEELKVEINTNQGTIENKLEEKLGSVQTHLEAQVQIPLSSLEAQIKQLTNQLSSVEQKVSQEIEKKLKTIDSMQVATRDELQEWKDLLEKKLSVSQPTLEITHLEKALEKLENSEKKMEEQFKAEINTTRGTIENTLDEKLGSVQTHLEAQVRIPLSSLEAQIRQLTNQLSSVDQKVSQEIEKKLKTIDSMQFATRDELQEWKDLLEKKLSASQPTLEITHLEKALEKLENSEKKTEEQFKAEINTTRGTIENTLDEKLGSVQTHLEAQVQIPLSSLEAQIKQLTNQLSSVDQKVSQEIEKKLKTIDSMQFATRDELQEWKDLLEKKLSASQPTLEITHMEKALEKRENSEKKTEEQFKAEINTTRGTIENTLDEKLGSVQTHLEAQVQIPLSSLEAQIKQLTNQLSSVDQKVSQEIEKKLKTIDSMQFATRDELQEWKDLLEKKLSASQPTLEITHLEKALEKRENSEKKTEEQFKAEINTTRGTIENTLDEKLGSVQTHLEAQVQIPLSSLEAQIKQLTNQLSSVDQKVSQEIEKKLKTIDSMQFATRDELQEWKDLLEKKLSASQPTLEITHLEKALEKRENSEKKTEEQFKAEINTTRGTIENTLDEKLGSVQTHLEAQVQIPLSSLEAQIKQLTNQLSSVDQKVSQEIEKKLKTIDSMQFATRDELQEWKDLLEKKLSASQPTLEIIHLEKALEKRENSDTEKHFEKEMEILRTELDWRRARNNADDITLAADTAHPNLSIAEDRKSFTHESQPQKVPPNPGRFYSTVCVLGSEGFSSGKHYWEVDIGSSTDWDLGVARKSTQRKGKLSLSAKEGIWTLSQCGRDYWAKTDPWTRVIVKKNLKKTGVYLSYQEGQVTFFNVTDMSVLFTFNDCSFSGEVYPFFKNSHKETTMRICCRKED